MGRVKEYLIEQEEGTLANPCQAEIRFTCPECKEKNYTTINTPMPPYAEDEEGAEELPPNEGETEVMCTNCYDIFDAYATVFYGSCEIKLTDYDDVEVIANMVWGHEFDPYDYAVPDDPCNVFKKSYATLKQILEHDMPREFQNEIYKMIFVQSIAAFEAYFCDTLINEVSRDKAKLEKIIKNDQELRKEKFSLEDVLQDPNLVQNRVIQYLKDKLYHRLDWVRNTYRNVLNINILPVCDETIYPKREQIKRLRENVALRHDCVHRNGRDKEGNLVKLRKDEVNNTLEFINSVIDHTEEKVTLSYFTVLPEEGAEPPSQAI